MRIYTPVDADAYGLLVYFHGGAFFLGSLDTHDHVARSLAEATGSRSSPSATASPLKHAFPAGLQDCYAVVRWAADHGDRAWPGTARPSPSPATAPAATFVAAVAAMAHGRQAGDRITHQVLFYPSLDLDFDVDRYASLRENAVGYGLETAGLKPFNAFYLDSGADPADPLVSPIKRAGPRRAAAGAHRHRRASTRCATRASSTASACCEAGVPVTVSRYAGAGHGFVQHFSWIPEYHRVFARDRPSS